MEGMTYETGKTAAAYWGTAPRPPGEVDPHGLGKPPRALTPALERYCKRATPSLFAAWVMLAGFFTASWILMVVTVPAALKQVPLLPLLFIGLSIWSGRKLAALRARIRFVLRVGSFVEALIRDLRCVEKRYGRRRVYEYHVLFDLGDRQVTLVTRDPGASLLQVGLRDQVLWHEREPEIVVPTYLVAA
jgi:hypothetical protein